MTTARWRDGATRQRDVGNRLCYDPNVPPKSAGERFQAANVSAKGTDPGARGVAGLVVPKRGAGAGWRWPAMSMNAPRA